MRKLTLLAGAAALNLALVLGAQAQVVVLPVATAPTTCGYWNGAVQAVSAEQVMVSPARLETRAIPAQYVTETRNEIVTPERVERHKEPAVYETVRETKIITPAKVVYREVPATVTTVSQPVITAPATSLVTTAYAPVVGPLGVAYAPVNYVAQTPVQYGSVQTQVVQTPASYVVDEVIPEKTKTTSRKVLVQAAKTYETVVPATYRTVSYTREIAPARNETVQIPAVYETRQVVRPVACASVMTYAPAVVATAWSTPVVQAIPMMTPVATVATAPVVAPTALMGAPINTVVTASTIAATPTGAVMPVVAAQQVITTPVQVAANPSPTAVVAHAAPPHGAAVHVANAHVAETR